MKELNKLTTEFDAEFDFDKMMNLANNNPEQFEEIRQQLIADFIKSIPKEKQHRMECLQWRIDQTRAQAKTPLAACMAITEMMWESFEQLNTLFMEMKDSDSTVRLNVAMPTADILPFKAAQI
jgi:hypothetical protein